MNLIQLMAILIYYVPLKCFALIHVHQSTSWQWTHNFLKEMWCVFIWFSCHLVTAQSPFLCGLLPIFMHEAGYAYSIWSAYTHFPFRYSTSYPCLILKVLLPIACTFLTSGGIYILIGLVSLHKFNHFVCNRNKATEDAQALYKAGEGKWGTDESCFNMILAQRSFPHLRAVFEEYNKISKKDIEEAIKSEFSGDLMQSLLTIGKRCSVSVVDKNHLIYIDCSFVC